MGVALLAVMIGALVQRSTGLGLALVAAPFLVAALGPHDGVTFGNTLMVLLCALVLARTWRGLDRRSVGLLLAGAVVGVPAGAVVVAVTPEGPLMILVGLLIGVGVAMSVFPVAGRMLAGTRGGLGAGAAAGLANTTAGVGGPMISAYALSRGMDPQRFVPTAQAVMMVVNAAAVVAKGGPPAVGAPVWVLGVAAILLGVALGGPVARRLSPTLARRLVLVIALAGAVATVIRGLTDL